MPSVPGFGDPNEPPWYIPQVESSAANPPDLCGPCGRLPPHRVSGEQYIHALGFGSSGEAGAIGVRGDFLYWAQGLSFFRGRTDGEGRPELIGQQSSGIGSGIVVDDSHIYWLDGTMLRATDLDSLESREEDIDLAAYYGAFDHEGDHIYVATRGCELIRQVSKSTLSTVRDFNIELPDEGPGGGATALAIDDTNIYCGNQNETYVQPKAGGDPIVLGEPATRIAAFVVAPERVYWRTQEVGNAYANLGYIDKETKQAVLVGQTPGQGGGRPTYDPSRNRLFWNSLTKVISFDLEEQKFGVHAWFRSNLGGTADSDYVYFGERVYGEPCDPVTIVGAITRFPKDSPTEPWPWIADE